MYLTCSWSKRAIPFPFHILKTRVKIHRLVTLSAFAIDQTPSIRSITNAGVFNIKRIGWITQIFLYLAELSSLLTTKSRQMQRHLMGFWPRYNLTTGVLYRQAKHVLHMYTVCGMCEGLLGIASQCLCSTDWNICTATKCNYFVFCIKILFPTIFFAGVTGSTVSIWAETAIRGRSVVVSQWAQIINSTDSTWVRYNHPSLLIPCAVLTIGIFRFRWIVRRFDRQVCKSIWIPW